MVNAYVNSWQEAMVTLAILFWLAFVFCGSLIGLYLCKDNNSWGILIATLALPVIGTVLALMIMQLQYQTITQWVRQLKMEKNHHQHKKHKKSH